MKNFIAGSLVTGGIVAGGLLLSSQQNDSIIPFTSPTSSIGEYNTCTVNGITQKMKITCEEHKEGLKNLCPLMFSNGDDMNCEDFETKEDAQDSYELSIMCFNYDVYKIDRDNDGIACE